MCHRISTITPQLCHYNIKKLQLACQASSVMGANKISFTNTGCGLNLLRSKYILLTLV